jgi:hypothetical protein
MSDERLGMCLYDRLNMRLRIDADERTLQLAQQLYIQLANNLDGPLFTQLCIRFCVVQQILLLEEFPYDCT